MKLSIVTISFNQARFLDEAIRSVLEQDYPDIEYIVVDPGSTDGSREIIEQYRERIDHIIFEPDEGPADGLNKGFERATGDIYAYLNADDILLPGAVSLFMEYFENHPHVDVCSAHGFKINGGGEVMGRTFSHRFDPRAYVFGACVLVQQSTFFRAAAFRMVGGFNKANRVSWDGELWFEMALADCRFSRMNDFLSCFRMHEESITVSGRVAHLEKQIKQRFAARLGLGASMIENDFLRGIYRVLWRLGDPGLTWMRLKEVFT